jgi:hypothetical protein
MTVGLSAPVPELLMVGVASTSMAFRRSVTTPNAALAPAVEPDINDTRILAGSDPIPSMPLRPWLTTSTSTSSRPTPSSSIASSIASSTVFPVCSRGCFSISSKLLIWQGFSECGTKS